jgi:hypothetical protein
MWLLWYLFLLLGMWLLWYLFLLLGLWLLWCLFLLSLNQWCDLFGQWLGLNKLFFLLFLFCLSLHPRLRHAHHLICHPIRFLFIHIPRLSDLQFRLNPRHHTLHIPVTMRALQCQ